MRRYELDLYLYLAQLDDEHDLQHHGVLGQKWGVRRYQNPDGSLTAEGRERYSDGNTSIKAATQYCDKHNRIGEAYSWIKENPNISEKDWQYALAVREYHYGKAESKISDIAKKTGKTYSEVWDETQKNSLDKDKTSFAIASATNAYKSFEKTGVVPRDKDYDAFVVKVQNMRASGKSPTEIRKKLDPYNKLDMDVYIDDMDEIQHHGVLGQKWGVRRYQNPDGSLTAEGRERYSNPKYQKQLGRRLAKDSYGYYSQLNSGVYSGSRGRFLMGINARADRYNKGRKAYDELSDSQKLVVRKAFNTSIKKRALADKAVSVALSGVVGTGFAVNLGAMGTLATGNPIAAIPGIAAGVGIATGASKQYLKDVNRVTNETKLYKKRLKKFNTF